MTLVLNTAALPFASESFAAASRFLSAESQAAVVSLPVSGSSFDHSLAVSAQAKFRRLTSFYQVPIVEALQKDLIAGLGRLQDVIARKDAHFEKGRSGAKARLSAVREVYPAGPRWLQDLLVHLYLEKKTHPDDMGFVLRAARLMQGVANEDIGVNGFNEHRIKYVEKGSLLKRGSFREAARLYGVPYRALAYSYLCKHGPEGDWRRLPFYDGPVFFEGVERIKAKAYFRRPGTLGERVFFARLARDLSQRELVEQVRKKIATLVPSGKLRSMPPKTDFNKQDLEHLEANWSYLPLAKCLALADVLDIYWDEFLKTLIKTYAPQLLAKSGRLRGEPVYINHGESGDERKILAYAQNPGSPGERIFWARKRKLWTIDDLAAVSGVRSDQIYPFELNRKGLNEESLGRLELALL